MATILLVEDERIFRHLLRAILEEAGPWSDRGLRWG